MNSLHRIARRIFLEDPTGPHAEPLRRALAKIEGVDLGPGYLPPRRRTSAEVAEVAARLNRTCERRRNSGRLTDHLHGRARRLWEMHRKLLARERNPNET